MELTEEALQQSAASPAHDGAEAEPRIGAQDTKDPAAAASGPQHDSASHTPDAQANVDVVMTDRNEAISQEEGGAAAQKTAGEDIAVYEDGEEDAEGEVDDDYEFMDAPVSQATDHPDQPDAASAAAPEGHTEDEDEGVGAVKLRPGEADEEDNESEASAGTHSEAESEDDAEWEEDDEDEEEVPANDEEESDHAQSNNCMFCKEDEDNDPSEEFDAYLTCAGCGVNCKWYSWTDNGERYQAANTMRSPPTMCPRGECDAARRL